MFRKIVPMAALLLVTACAGMAATPPCTHCQGHCPARCESCACGCADKKAGATGEKPCKICMESEKKSAQSKIN